MILVEEKGQRDPQLVVIRQTDHAFLAGFFAREWGNEQFSKPEPNASFCLAAAEHDNGWSEWELQPELDPKTRLPERFQLDPGQSMKARITFEVTPGEYQFMFGYGGWCS